MIVLNVKKKVIISWRTRFPDLYPDPISFVGEVLTVDATPPWTRVEFYHITMYLHPCFFTLLFANNWCASASNDYNIAVILLLLKYAEGVQLTVLMSFAASLLQTFSPLNVANLLQMLLWTCNRYCCKHNLLWTCFNLRALSEESYHHSFFFPTLLFCLSRNLFWNIIGVSCRYATMFRKFLILTWSIMGV